MAQEIDVVIVPRTRDLGDGFTVRRALPAAERRMVGPFVFWDHMGPTVVAPGKGLDVRPHPHIGLATVTYLFDGEIMHRDSLGTVQPIRPGAVNWMVAGRGIVHSERTPPELRAAGPSLSGIQSWVALPREQEECEPAFTHYPAEALPEMEGEGIRVRLIAGSLGGGTSPVQTASETLYAEIVLVPGAQMAVAAHYAERAIYVVSGRVFLAGRVCVPGELMVLAKGTAPTLATQEYSRLMLFGGAPMDGPRHIWWNFVSSSTARIEQAKDDWRQGRFPPVPDETDCIPLPESPKPGPVSYP
jgi:redox-sensitive bicupin YhaK (pirin superfamily)